jgi:hypothetical protein
VELSQGSLAEMKELPELFGANLFCLEHSQFCEHLAYHNARKNIPYLHDQIHPPGMTTLFHATALRQPKYEGIPYSAVL